MVPTLLAIGALWLGLPGAPLSLAGRPEAAPDETDAREPQTSPEDETDAADDDKVVKSDSEWRKILTKEQFNVTRRKATERAFKNAYWKTKKAGVYHCVCCGEPLFDSKTKFDSGTGWPSFTKPIDKKAVAYREDRGETEVRTEVLCRRCDAHLGHVFDDGPRPTGQRFCMNSAALKLVERAESKKGDSKKNYDAAVDLPAKKSR
ncbi:MAG: peptide-methionine (R)-S-oxide reductase [Planctomycetaceae bacterium]|nr:peptide-methionine (R)-S-oxide reductase [Planctomycetaceae bacterium]